MVASESGDQLWTLTTRRRGRNWLLEVTDQAGNSWAADGPDLFETLRVLRRALAVRTMAQLPATSWVMAGDCGRGGRSAETGEGDLALSAVCECDQTGRLIHKGRLRR